LKIFVRIVAAIACGFLGLVAFLLFPLVFPESASRHFRVEVELLVDGERRKFTAIQQLKIVRLPWWGLQQTSDYSLSVSGNAVFMELPDRSPLIALMRYDKPADAIGLFDHPDDYAKSLSAVCNYFFEEEQPKSRPSKIIQKLREYSGSCVFEDELLPAFGFMTDFPDLRTFKYVDPMNLDGSFSSGVELLSISLHPTNKRIEGNLVERILSVEPDKPNAEPTGALGGVPLVNYQNEIPRVHFNTIYLSRE